MKLLRNIGSLAFVLGIFTAVFVGIPWHVINLKDPVIPIWLRIAIFCFLGGFLLVLLTVALEQMRQRAKYKEIADTMPSAYPDSSILLLNSNEIPGHNITEVLGVIQGHTIFAIWLGKDLSALVRLILGGELFENTEMMGRARKVATQRMIGQAEEMGADAIINLRYMTTSVVGSAAELLAYGTAVKLDK